MIMRSRREKKRLPPMKSNPNKKNQSVIHLESWMRLRKFETRSSSPPAGRSSAGTIEIDQVNPLPHQGPPHSIPHPPPVVGNPKISCFEPAVVGASNVLPDRLDLLARELAMPRVPNGFRKVRRGTVAVMGMAMRIDGGL